MNMKSTIDKVHKYKTSPPSFNNKRWQTYVMTSQNERKKVVAPKKEDLYRKLYDFYQKQSSESRVKELLTDDSIRAYETVVLTVTNMFPVWLQYQKYRNISDLSEARHINYWNKYYKGISFVVTDLKLIDAMTTKLKPFLLIQITLPFY
jgi:vacuolar-type H+-ATPase catalytic subunit A/Vma1